MRVLSPMPAGNGATVVHQYLETHITGYRVAPYNPWWTLMPPALWFFSRGKADLIHTVADYAIFSARPRTPLVVTFQNYVLDSFMSAYSTLPQKLHYATDLRWFTHLALQRASVVTAVSHFTAGLVTRDTQFSRPIQIIPNGVDTARFVPPGHKTSRATIRVLFSGNLTLRKGANFLPAIAGRLPRGVEIVCATGLRGGTMPLSAPNIRVIGRVRHADMPALYQDVDLLLMPTVREGLSLAVLEAMASGLPVVATNCSSLPELIHDGRGGFLCELGNVEEFADKIAFLADAPDLRRQMGDYNRARVEREFTLQHMVSSYRMLFESVLDTRS